MSDTRVSVREGVVQLQGKVLNASLIDRAGQLAARFEGVYYIDNDLITETNVGTRVTPAFERLQEYLNRTAAFFPILLVALLVFSVFLALSGLIGRWRYPSRRFKNNPLVWGVVRRLVRSIIVLVGLLLAFDILGITTRVGALLGTAGVLGLALGFAFKDIVENYLAGLLLSIRRPFRASDLVRINEFEGKVVQLTSRELILLSLDGNHIRLLNAVVFKTTLINFTRNPMRMFSFDVGIGVGEDLTKAMEIGIQTLSFMKGVVSEPPPFARIQELGASNVVVRFFGWVDQRTSDFFKVNSEAIRLVKAALDQAGFDLPEPVYRIHIVQPSSDARPRTHLSMDRIKQKARTLDVQPGDSVQGQVDAELNRNLENNLLSDSPVE